MKTKIKPIFLASCMMASSAAFAQNPSTSNLNGSDSRVVTTTVPFLGITPDSRGGGMGDAGVAVSPDANTMHWNPAKLAFMQNDFGFSISYTPWLRALVPDISLSYLAGYKRINNNSGFGGSLRYFSLGDITFTDDRGQPLKVHRPYEFAVDAGYALKLSPKFSIGVAGRFIYSNLSSNLMGNGVAASPAYTFAGDIAAYYRKDVKLGKNTGELAFGGNISNIGGKITYTEAAERDFIPANLRLGSSLTVKINEYNTIGFALDFNKLLVPTTPVYKLDSLGNPIPVQNQPGKFEIEKGRDPDVPTISGMINSFGDAPGGFKEEINEINPSLGVEYWYNKQFAGRLGYFYEHPTKGNRQYLTVGFGIRYSTLGLDIAYLVPTNSSKTFNRSPLENTLRFSLLFAFNNRKGGTEQVQPAN